ncbi:MAG: radical SAM protein [Coriobacteriia bacterium]|nr:radical SAM protein [Coriobacteriia bacterium]
MAHVRSLFFTGAASQSESKAQEAKRLGRPSSLIWNITNRCNLLCDHCYLGADTRAKPDQLSAEAAFDMIDRMHQAGVPVVFLSGGEPMMHPHFWQILERINAAGLRPTISTNCTFIGPDSAARLAANGVRFVATSLYGPRDFHDQMVGVAGTYDTIIAAIGHLRAAGVKVVIKIAVSQSTYPYLYDLIALAKQLDCAMVYVCDLITAGRSAGEDDQRISAAQWRDFCDFIVDEVADPDNHFEYDIGAIPSTIPYIARGLKARGLDISKGIERLKIFSACPIGQGHMTINSQGGIMPCQFAQDWTLGNIHELSFAQATSRLAELDKAVLEGQCSTDECAYSRLCRGCRVKAYHRTGGSCGGNPNAADITCILEPCERTHT